MQPNRLYDLTRLTQITASNMVFIKKMILLFLHQSPIDLTELKKATENTDIKKIKEVAHRMKPAIDNMGIDTLTSVIREIEQYNGTEVTDGLRVKLMLTEDTLNKVFTELQQDVIQI